MNLKTALVLLAFVLILGIGAYFLWTRGDDCSFSSKKRSLGIDLEAGLSDVKAIKGKVGITDDQVRDFDELGKDLAEKYDMLCQDHKQKRVMMLPIYAAAITWIRSSIRLKRHLQRPNRTKAPVLLRSLAQPQLSERRISPIL